MKLVFLSVSIDVEHPLREARKLFAGIKKEGKVYPMMPYAIAAETHRADVALRVVSRRLLSMYGMVQMQPDELWICGEYTYPEIQSEIALAEQLGIPIIRRPAR